MNQANTWELPAYDKTEYFPKRSKYAVIIPVINEGERIKNQLIRMRPYLDTTDTIIIDGGSTDGSVSPEGLRPSGLRTFIVKTGPGKLSAQLRIGLAYAMEQGYEGVILIDGNNKDDPAAIPNFIEKLEEGYDHIQGSRFIRGGKALNNPWWRLLAIRLIHAPLVSIASGIWYTDTTNGFRAYSRRFLEHPRVQPFREVFSTYELHYYLSIQAGKQKVRATEIPVVREYPPGEVPTKITKVRGNALVLQTLWNACVGKYDPEYKSEGAS